MATQMLIEPRWVDEQVARRLVRTHLSPTPEQQESVSRVYEALRSALGRYVLFQSGSYARFTAIRPPHDLDVIVRIGGRECRVDDASRAIADVRDDVERRFVSPIPGWSFRAVAQTHSVCVEFSSGGSPQFSVDLVPAIEVGVNAEQEPLYLVPEILRAGHSARVRMYEEAKAGKRVIEWIVSDPRGYIHDARVLNLRNPDFRKAVKLVKSWRAVCRTRGPFALKSFHIELAIAREFTRAPAITLLAAAQSMLRDMPRLLEKPQFPDRADSARYVDRYVSALDPEQRRLIVLAADAFAYRLDRFTPATSIDQLLGGAWPPVPAEKANRAPVVRIPLTPLRPWSA